MSNSNLRIVKSNSQVQLIKADLMELSSDEILKIAGTEYSDNNWSQLAYYLYKDDFSMNRDVDYFKEISKKTREYNNSVVELYGSSSLIKCLYSDSFTYFIEGLDSITEFRYYSGVNFSGSIGVFSCKVKGISKKSKFELIENIVRDRVYKADGNYNAFFIAFYSEDDSNWECALVPPPEVSYGSKTLSFEVSILCFARVFFKCQSVGVAVPNSCISPYTIKLEAFSEQQLVKYEN